MRFLYWLLNLWPRRCGCCWIWPYGFVPEAGCPWHDKSPAAGYIEEDDKNEVGIFNRISG